MRLRSVGAIALSVALVATGAACSNKSGSSGGGSGSKSNTTNSFNAANGQVFNPSTKKGGTLKMAVSSAWDSTDPGDTYYAMSWNFSRMYIRISYIACARSSYERSRRMKRTTPKKAP